MTASAPLHRQVPRHSTVLALCAQARADYHAARERAAEASVLVLATLRYAGHGHIVGKNALADIP